MLTVGSVTVCTTAPGQKIANRRPQDDDKSQPRFNEIMEVGEEWSLDTIGPLPADESGSTCHIMVAIRVDGLSRFVVLEPASDHASGESVARFLTDPVAALGPKRVFSALCTASI